jgi:non-lysosomal glucosylceramidase
VNVPNGAKKNGQKKSRRKFLKHAVIGAGALALPGASQKLRAKVPGRAQTSPDIENLQTSIEYPRLFMGPQRKMLAFPLGGVGAGSISLGGRGQLCEWWIFNRPDKENSPQYAFPSIWVQAGSRTPVARVLEARIMPPYEGASGLGSANAPGLPRLASCTFTGEFPLAHVAFEDSDLPVSVSLQAFTPFIPVEPDDSGLPVAVLRYYVSNPRASKATVSIAFSVDNPVGDKNASQGRTNEFREAGELGGLLMRNPFLAANHPLAGTFAVAALGAGSGELSYVRGWPAGRWWESPLLFWQDFSSDGELGPEASARTAVGSVCLKRMIPARGRAEFTFLLAWRFPNRTAARCGWTAPKGRENDLLGNHYCARFTDAWAAAQYAAERLPKLEGLTRQFVGIMRQATLPGCVKDAATANLATLITQTSFRIQDGSFHGFEGCNDQAGCCFGNCTHVYAYEAAIANLFPQLSRSLREQQFGFLTSSEGLMDYRELLPFGIERFGVAAADGQMACIMKLYYDWRLSGDTAWLRNLWPTAKKALEFAWVEGGWDANRDGVMEGVQHNTYDVEFIGPNPLCGIWYLGGLRAGEEMARAVGDSEAARQYRRLFEHGSRWIDANLFNGEYYIQKIGSIPRDQVAKGLIEGMGSADTENPTFQLGEGCLVDQLVGQYFAEVAGLGFLLDPQHVHKTLESIYKYNYKRTLSDHECVMRTFALNDEAALVICDYPHGNRPRVPFPYFEEVMTGFEYSAAILMLYMGRTSEGLEVIANIRRRYDGERRNAWDEAECGYHYARPMASWAAILALSGFRYHGAEKRLEAKPMIHRDLFSCFWSTPSGWGSFSQEVQKGKAVVSFAVTHGALVCRTIALAPPATSRAITLAKLGGHALSHEFRRGPNETVFKFHDDVTIPTGGQLVLTL